MFLCRIKLSPKIDLAVESADARRSMSRFVFHRIRVSMEISIHFQSGPHGLSEQGQMALVFAIVARDRLEC